MRYPGDPDRVTRIDPDEAGEYLVTGGAGGWQAVDPGCCDRIAGQIPAPGMTQRFVMLTHTPDMRLPHDRFRVTDLHRGPAPGEYTARLTLDGQPVAALTGNGRRLRMRVFPDTPLGRNTWDAYVAACRFRGAPTTGRRVLEALVEEQDLAQLTANAWVGGGTVVRLLDHDHATIEAHEVMPRPADPADHHDLYTRLAAHPTPGAAGWVIWTATRWRWLRSAGGQA